MVYRNLNVITKADSRTIPRIDDCIDAIANAKYITNSDLLTGYWIMPLTDSAKQISGFITLSGNYQC